MCMAGIDGRKRLCGRSSNWVFDIRSYEHFGCVPKEVGSCVGEFVLKHVKLFIEKCIVGIIEMKLEAVVCIASTQAFEPKWKLAFSRATLFKGDAALEPKWLRNVYV